MPESPRHRRVATEALRSPGRRDAQQACAPRLVGREHDRVVLAPRAAAIARRIGQRDGRPACHGNLLQLVAGEKANPPSIGGKKRAEGIVCPRQRRSMQLVELPHVELRRSLTLLRDKRDDGAVWREDRGVSKLNVVASQRGVCAQLRADAQRCGRRHFSPGSPRTRTSASPAASAAAIHGQARWRSGSGLVVGVDSSGSSCWRRPSLHRSSSDA